MNKFALKIFTCIVIIIFSIPTSVYSIRIEDNFSLKSENKWIKTFGSVGMDSCYSIQQTEDQGYIIAGAVTTLRDMKWDGIILKIDEYGQKIWKKTFGLKGKYDYCNSIIEVASGEYVTAGYTESYGLGDKDAWLIRVDEDGEILWNKTFGGIEYDYAQSIQQTSDGGFILMGGTSSFGAGDMDFWMIKTDEDGTMQWNKTYGGSEFDYGEEGWQTSDGGYIFLGYTYSFGNGESDAWVIKTDENGNVQWNMTYGDSGQEIGNSILQTPDKGYIISGGSTQDDKKYDLWILKIDQNGNETWTRKIKGRLSINFGWCIQQTNDCGYIISGSTRGIYTGSFGTGLLSQVLLLKIDENGTTQWQKKTRSRIGIGCKVLQTNDNGYVIAGYSGGYGNARDILVIKTNETGKPLYKFNLWI